MDDSRAGRRIVFTSKSVPVAQPGLIKAPVQHDGQAPNVNMQAYTTCSEREMSPGPTKTAMISGLL